MNHSLSGTHRATFDALFHHPISHNLQWREVYAMLSSLSEKTEEHAGGKVKFTRNGQTLFVHPPAQKDFSDTEQLMSIRHYLERSEVAPPTDTVDTGHLLVVIDHREARIFKAEMKGAEPNRVLARNFEGSNCHLHYVSNDGGGQRRPESKAFFEAVSQSLKKATEILIFGSSTGASSAMDYLLAELTEHHPAVADRVIGTVSVNEQHMSEDQLLAAARSFYAARVASAK